MRLQTGSMCGASPGDETRHLEQRRFVDDLKKVAHVLLKA